MSDRLTHDRAQSRARTRARSRGQSRARSEQGSGAIEVSVAVTSLLLVMWFVIGGLRITTAGGDVHAAAREAARAAAVHYHQGNADAAASTVARDVLASRGVSCRNLAVAVSPLTRGATITATVTCVVSLADVSRVGFPASRTLTGTAVDFVDRIRGDG